MRWHQKVDGLCVVVVRSLYRVVRYDMLVKWSCACQHNATGLKSLHIRVDISLHFGFRDASETYHNAESHVRTKCSISKNTVTVKEEIGGSAVNLLQPRLGGSRSCDHKYDSRLHKKLKLKVVSFIRWRGKSLRLCNHDLWVSGDFGDFDDAQCRGGEVCLTRRRRGGGGVGGGRCRCPVPCLSGDWQCSQRLHSAR